MSAPIGHKDQSDPGKVGGAHASPSPSSSSPLATSPLLDGRSTDSWDVDSPGDDLAQLVEQVNREARVLASQTHRRKSCPRGHTHSRSHGNLVDLQDEEEDLVKRDKLKYPSDCAMDTTYYQMLQDKDKTLKALHRLTHHSQEDATPRNSHGITMDSVVATDLETSFSEPNLHQSEGHTLPVVIMSYIDTLDVLPFTMLSTYYYYYLLIIIIIYHAQDLLLLCSGLIIIIIYHAQDLLLLLLFTMLSTYYYYYYLPCSGLIIIIIIYHAQDLLLLLLFTMLRTYYYYYYLPCSGLIIIIIYHAQDLLLLLFTMLSTYYYYFIYFLPDYLALLFVCLFVLLFFHLD